jgi:hypothetical protein
MTTKEFQKRKRGLILSTDPIKRMGGRAYLDVETEWNKSSETWMGEEMDLSKAAKRCFDREKVRHDPDLQKMAFYKELMVKTMGYVQTKRLLFRNGCRNLDDAIVLLKNTNDYDKIDPDVVRRIMDETRDDVS